MELWELLLTTGAVSGLVSLVFSLIRDRNLESFKTELRKEVFEHDTKFASRHDKQTEVIVQIHRLIDEATAKVRQLEGAKYRAPRIEGQQASPPYDPLEAARQADSALEAYFRANKLYLSDHQAALVEEIVQSLWQGWFNASGVLSGVIEGDMLEEMERAYADALELAVSLTIELETSFRQTLEA